MKNRVDALRLSIGGSGTILLPTEYNDDDALVCKIPVGEVTIPSGDNQFNLLLNSLADKGIHPDGCFNCRYFHQPGATDDVDDVIGYCLEGKIGHHVDPLKDLTSKERSCDAFNKDENHDRERVIEEWRRKLPKRIDPKGTI